MDEEKKIMTMSKMALYDEGYKKECMKVCSFFKRDYVAFQTLMTLLWATLGYLVVVGAALFVRIDELTSNLSIDLIIELAVFIIGCYVATLVVFIVICLFFYNYKYGKSLRVAKKYYKSLGLLNREYKREK